MVIPVVAATLDTPVRVPVTPVVQVIPIAPAIIAISIKP